MPSTSFLRRGIFFLTTSHTKLLVDTEVIVDQAVSHPGHRPKIKDEIIRCNMPYRKDTAEGSRRILMDNEALRGRVTQTYSDGTLKWNGSKGNEVRHKRCLGPHQAARLTYSTSLRIYGPR